MQRDKDIIQDILHACSSIESYLSDFDESSFHKDEKTQSAVIYQLLILGEAVGRLSEEMRTKNSNIPWQDWRSFRNILIHQYDGIEIEQVWYTVHREIPDLVAKLNDILLEQSE